MILLVLHAQLWHLKG